MKYIDVVGKTIQDAIKQGIAELNTTEDNVEVTVLKQAGRFSKAKVRLTVIDENLDKKEEPKIFSLSDYEKNIDVKQEDSIQENKDNEIKVATQSNAEQDQAVEVKNLDELTSVAGKILAEVCAKISPNIEIKENKKERVLVYEISGEGSEKLIGKGGQALDAMQLVLNSINRHKEPDMPYIVLRIAEYEKMKENKLQKIAVDAANKAIEINNTVRLETMNSYERRIVHAYLQQDERVETESFGVEPYRYITVRPKNKSE